MYKKLTILAALAVVSLFITAGCATNGDSKGGWIVIDRPERTPPPPPQKTKPPVTAKNDRGMEQAARNHLRSAYRFLEKNKPSHAQRELEKARYKLRNDYRVYYYIGGAYYLQGMYEKAVDSWQTAHRYTTNSRTRSRLRTCQAYAIIHLEGEKGSIPFLDRAVDLDEENDHAMELLKSFEISRDVKEESKWKKISKPGIGRSSRQNEEVEHSRYAEELIQGRDNTGNNTKNKHDNGKKDESKDREGGKQGKKDQNKFKNSGKTKFDIRDQEQFREYFLIEMF